MNLYLAIGVVAVLVWIAVTYIELKIDNLINEGMRKIESRAYEITKLIEETNVLLREIKEIEFEIDGSSIRNKNLYKSKVTNYYEYVDPFKKLNELEEKIKNTGKVKDS
jgi:hypothetical protein